MVATRKPLTVTDFEAFLTRPENQDRIFELIGGEIVEKMPTELHGAIVAIIITEIVLYLRQNRSGRVTTEARHSVDKNNDYLPDISFILDANRTAVEKGAITRMPDLAVEVKSPADTLKGLRQKARYYLEHGTQLVWIVLPQQKVVEVYTPSDETVVGEDEALSGGTVLPGFTLSVKTIFEV